MTIEITITLICVVVVLCRILYLKRRNTGIERVLKYMACSIGVMLLVFVFTLMLNKSVGKSYSAKITLIQMCEYAYMEAQIDSLENRVRIVAFTNDYMDTDYRWIESPWEDTKRTPKFSTYSEYKNHYAKTFEQ